MENYLKNQPVNEGQTGRLSRESMKQIKGALSDLTPKERCEADHVGRCGDCDKDGYFTPCA
ncbi:hypothetical protein ACFQZI_14325 [Mucilaginibacter lutimaris]|uniref:Uncharacterized protein n=1 Tax=Mucilaginibacter lutimaris TaxID=931629 RepID=A0ABW2ZIJ2_9SPHI